MNTRAGLGLRWTLALGVLLAACGSDPKAEMSGRDGSTPTPGDAGENPPDGDASAGVDAGANTRFTVGGGPGTLTLSSEPYETVTFVLQDRGAPVAGVRFSVDRTELGSIDPDTGVFTPSGVAGTVTITAASDEGSARTTLVIQVTLAQEGDPGRDELPAGAGGVGGVGGEGGGTPITDSDVRAILDTEPEQDDALSFLYPYDGTVWPRGLVAPLLSWKAGAFAPIAVRIHVEVDDGYRYDGYFGPPAMLPAGRAITHLPLPQSVWRAALLSGSTMRVSLVVAARDGGGALKAYRPASHLTWTIAPGSLKGTVYYNSYGTKLAENFNGAIGGNGRFGGATLAVRGDSYDPQLIAGSTTTDSSGCRVCHTVSGDGSLMMVQREPYVRTSAYDLTNNNMEMPRPNADDGKFGWAALSPDGTIALGNSGPPSDETGGNVSSGPESFLYDTSTGARLGAAGLSEFVRRAATPTFAPDGSMVAFNFFAGPGNGALTGNGQSLVVMDVVRNDPANYTFSNPRGVYTSSTTAPAWPTFLPDGSGLVFQREISHPNSERFLTRYGARGDLWWTDLNGESHPLDRANGAMGLPRTALHPNDEELQYEPAVGPIVAGGYAWVVFTSRRMYGDIATRAPTESDPRNFNLTPASADGPTTKKLWVFAFDMPPTPGTDPSHPPFYLPAQELYAGNSRGFWVPDACKEAGVGCTSGDECCGGYCRRFTEFGDAVCTDKLPPATCAAEYEACAENADCCDGGDTLFCVNNRCAQLIVR